MSKDGPLSWNDCRLTDLEDEALGRSPENDPNLDTVNSNGRAIGRIDARDRRGEPRRTIPNNHDLEIFQRLSWEWLQLAPISREIRRSDWKLADTSARNYGSTDCWRAEYLRIRFVDADA